MARRSRGSSPAAACPGPCPWSEGIALGHVQPHGPGDCWVSQEEGEQQDAWPLPRLVWLVMCLNLRCFNSPCRRRRRRWQAGVGRQPFWEGRHQSVLWNMHRNLSVGNPQKGLCALCCPGQDTLFHDLIVTCTYILFSLVIRPSPSDVLLNVDFCAWLGIYTSGTSVTCVGTLCIVLGSCALKGGTASCFKTFAELRLSLVDEGRIHCCPLSMVDSLYLFSPESF